MRIKFKNILVGTDFSDFSNAALEYGRAMARQFGARLHVLHTAEIVPGPDVVGMAGVVAAVPQLYKELEEAARHQLEAAVTDQDRSELRAKTVMTSGEAPAQAISEYATENDIDLIVIGTHGRRGLAHMVMGSVAEKVVRTAPCPVLTVKK